MLTQQDTIVQLFHCHINEIASCSMSNELQAYLLRKRNKNIFKSLIEQEFEKEDDFAETTKEGLKTALEDNYQKIMTRIKSPHSKLI